MLGRILASLGDDIGKGVRALRPDSEDYAAVFDVPFARRMEANAEWAWNEVETNAKTNRVAGIHVGPNGPSETDVFVYSLTPERLQKPGSELCGRGYVTSGIEKHIKPEVTVYCLGFAPEGKRPREGEMVDALVYVRGHWALFPRPWQLGSEEKCPAHVTSSPTPLVVPPIPPRGAPTPGSIADAKRLLEEFLEKKAESRTLLARLRPEHADYLAVYEEPTASTIEKAMAPKWERAARGADLLEARDRVIPRERDDVVYVSSATSEALRDGHHDCSSGYTKVASAIRSRVVIVCFGFTQLGLAEGASMDGLVYARGRWVLIPRPWEAVP
jgi:hypothetical protein